MDSAFFEPLGQDSYLATAATVGPWSTDAQHGGPPSALAARAIEGHQPDGRQRLARVAIDILRPVPVGKVSIRTRMVRPGRRVCLVEAVMEADGQEVLHARGWRIERPSGAVPQVPDGDPPATIPDGSAGLPPQLFTRDRRGYLAAIEWRFLPGPTSHDAAHGRDAAQGRAAYGGDVVPSRDRDRSGSVSQEIRPGRAAWARPRIPLLPGEESSPMSRTLLLADSGSGVGAVLPAAEYLFINVDLTVVLPRDPVGPWLLLESSTTVGPDGTGLAVTRLCDQAGACGRGIQTLLIAPRHASR